MRIKNRIIAGVLCTMLGITSLVGMTSNVHAAEVAKTGVSLGADLNEGQRAQVLGLMNLNEESLAKTTVVTVSNAEEHAAFDNYLPQSVIGNISLTSAKVVLKEDGNGIRVASQNINYCTTEMYQNALITAGVRNADVVVVGPMPLSGTAALLGVTKVYQEMTGKELQEEGVDVAADELVTTSELGEELGDQEKAAELIAIVKEAVAEGIEGEEEIREITEKAAEELGITLTEEQYQEIIDLMKRISKLNLDKDELVQQAKDLYESLKQKGLDLGLSDINTDGLINTFVNWFISLWEKLKGFFA